MNLRANANLSDQSLKIIKYLKFASYSNGIVKRDCVELGLLEPTRLLASR